MALRQWQSAALGPGDAVIGVSDRLPCFRRSALTSPLSKAVLHSAMASVTSRSQTLRSIERTKNTPAKLGPHELRTETEQ
jgi:hypothetical protein